MANARGHGLPLNCAWGVSILLHSQALSSFGGLLVFFVYLSVEGLVKLMGNDHPIVHIGADIVLWSIVGVWTAKAIMERRTSVPRVPFLIVLVLHITWVGSLVFSPYTASIFVG